MKPWWCVALALALAPLGCETRAVDATPAGAAREFVERLMRMHGDRDAATAVFELLAPATRENLEARARRYGAASGKNIAPEAMLAPSGLVLRWQPRRYEAVIVGAHALVDVYGMLPDEHTRLRSVYEDGGWRILIDLPPLAELRTSPREDVPRPVKR